MGLSACEVDWEQSFRNFERVQRLVVPGAPMESVQLVNPLVEAAGAMAAGGGSERSGRGRRRAVAGRAIAGSREG